MRCLSCPSLYFHDEAARWRDTFGLVNFEFDRRWESDPGFVFYDCYRPTEIAEQLHGQFDFIVADPPAINNRTLECYAATIKLLAARGAKGEKAHKGPSQPHGPHTPTPYTHPPTHRLTDPIHAPMHQSVYQSNPA